MNFTFFCWHKNKKVPMLSLELEEKFWTDFALKITEQECSGDMTYWNQEQNYFKDSMAPYRIYNEEFPCWKLYSFYCDCETNSKSNHFSKYCANSKHFLYIESWFKNGITKHRETGPAVIRYSHLGVAKENVFCLDGEVIGENLPFTSRQEIIDYHQNNLLML